MLVLWALRWVVVTRAQLRGTHVAAALPSMRTLACLVLQDNPEEPEWVPGPWAAQA